MILFGIIAILFCHACVALANDVANVKVELFVETLCPYCSKLMNTEIKELLHDGIFDMANVSMVPSGNAHMAPDNSITCQHGEKECYWNRVLACVINSSQDQSTILQYATCSEATPPLDIAKQAKPCLEELGMSFEDIDACANGDIGAELAAAAFKRTAALQPPHRYVPWVVVNGQPLYGDYINLRRYICAAYAGPKPEACFKEGLARTGAVGDPTPANPGVTAVDSLMKEAGGPQIASARRSLRPTERDPISALARR